MFMWDFAKGGLQGLKRNLKGEMSDENLNYALTYIWNLIPKGSSVSAGGQISAPCRHPPAEAGVTTQPVSFFSHFIKNMRSYYLIPGSANAVYLW